MISAARAREGIRTVTARSNRLLALSAATGVVTGAGVAAFEWLSRDEVYERLLGLPLAVQVLAPLVGLGLTAIALRYLAGGASPATSDEYIRNFHQHQRRLDLRPFWGRMVGALATLGTGGALGYEGPSLYLGASVGTGVQRRFVRHSAREELKVLMVAGAAAGVAAIFKAPATGAVFAIEVPYRDDNAKRTLLPALLGAATGYLTSVALVGTAPLFEVEGTPPFDFKELGGAVLLGLLCGLGARGFAHVVRYAKAWSVRGHPVARVGVAGAGLALLAIGSWALFDEPLALGSGYSTLRWVTEPDHSLGLIAILFAVRLLATACTVGGGGVGGLFVPLVIAGSLVGDAMATMLDDPSTVFPLIGVAAFLGAGYRTPLAGVMFVAETTGRPGFVVPGLIASVAAQLVMGSASVSPYQASGRTGHLEARLRLPVTTAINADVLTVPSDTTIAEFYDHHLLLNRRLDVPVVDGSRFLGMVSLQSLQQVAMAEWSHVSVVEVIEPDWPVARPSWSLEEAVRAMEAGGVDVLPVVDDGDAFVGIVSASDVVRLDEILASTTPTDATA